MKEIMSSNVGLLEAAKAKQNIREGKKVVYLLAINMDFVHKGTRIPLGWCELLQWPLEQAICHVSKQSCCADKCICMEH